MHHYSIEKNVQIIVALLKAHGIRYVIASPGATNVCLTASLQSDDYFKIYSSVDERSAAYLACGLAAETEEPVVLTCTEATASRNYLPGLTEAFYRKLPVLAITATNNKFYVGQNHPQMIDRSVLPVDVARKSVYIPILRTPKEERGYAVLVNDAILELTRNGGGPVHLEYETEYSQDYSITSLPSVNVIHRITYREVFPELPQGNTAIYVGEHNRWSDTMTELVDAFCEKYGAVVLTDHIGNYHGKYGVPFTLVTSQWQKRYSCCNIDTLIYIGNISSSYKKQWNIKCSWRINPDGKVRNVFGNLAYVFQMKETDFFRQYVENGHHIAGSNLYYQEWMSTYEGLKQKIPELPLSNLWVAQNTLPLLPEGATLFLGIENTLRCWNFFKTNKRLEGFCNTGGFGIDGGVSSMIGAALANPKKIFYGIIGDLSFFYDINVLGNRHVGKNLRLMVINNGLGQQFKNPGHPAGVLGESSSIYVAAAGHYGNRSRSLVKNYAESLGYQYLVAESKEEFLAVVEEFTSSDIGDRSIIFEVFTDTKDETQALSLISNLEVSLGGVSKETAKKLLGKSGVKKLSKILNQKAANPGIYGE